MPPLYSKCCRKCVFDVDEEGERRHGEGGRRCVCVKERERENHHSLSDSSGRHACVDCRSFTRLPSSASDTEGTVAKARAVTQLIRRFWLLRRRRCDPSVGLLSDCGARSDREEGEREKERGKKGIVWKTLFVLFFNVYMSTSVTLRLCVCISVFLIRLKASDSEQRSPEASGASHIKHTVGSKQLYRLRFIREKDFKHPP